MIEDGKIFDYEPDWTICNHGRDKKLYYVNKSLSSLYRIIDPERQLYDFSDIGRIKRVREINHILTKDDDEESNKKLYLSLLNKILDEIYPIDMPYLPQTLTAFIEVIPSFNGERDCLGILYYRDETNGIEDSEMVKANRFYRIHPVPTYGPAYEEIDRADFIKIKEKYDKGVKVNG